MGREVGSNEKQNILTLKFTTALIGVISGGWGEVETYVSMFDFQ